jgi:ABC-type cobalamin/Fe3+-siderophores transport systems, ATPase components
MELTVDRLLVAKNRAKILDIAFLNFGARGLVGLIGPNGAGKSTLLKAICGIEKPSSGSIRLGGRELREMDSHQRAALIGYIPQHFQPCWNQKTAELIQLAAERTGQPELSFKQAVENFELAHLLNRPWDSLSGGERGRVALAMALSGDPPLILADEPGAAMDIGHNLNMLETFKAIAAKALVIVCLHDLNLGLRFFDRVAVMRGGRVAYFGEADGLVAGDLLNEVFEVDFAKVKTEVSWVLQPLQRKI